MSRHHFGTVRKLPSGRWQARFRFQGPAGSRQTAPNTFATKADANRWLAKAEVDIGRGAWLDQELGRTQFGEYARQWIEDNPRLGPRSRETHRRNLRLHLSPLEHVPLTALTPTVVRRWHSDALRGPGGNTSIGQAYRLVRAVMNTAVREGIIARNPCQIPGPGRPGQNAELSQHRSRWRHWSRRYLVPKGGRAAGRLGRSPPR